MNIKNTIIDQLKQEPGGSSNYMFCGKRCDRIKVLLREPDGYVLRSITPSGESSKIFLEIIEAQMESYLGEDNIARIDDVYERA